MAQLLPKPFFFLCIFFNLFTVTLVPILAFKLRKDQVRRQPFRSLSTIGIGMIVHHYKGKDMNFEAFGKLAKRYSDNYYSSPDLMG